MLLQNKNRRFKTPPFILFFYKKHNKMQKFKELNQYEVLGLINILEEAFPYVKEQICGTSQDNLINLQNTITENCPNDKFCMLGAFGLTEGHDIVLEYWDYPEQNESFKYWITFRDARDYNAMELKPFNAYLKKLSND